MAAKDRNIWILIVFLLSGLVLGGLLRRNSKEGRLLMVVILWARIWTFKSNCIRLKHNKTNIWTNI